MKAKLWLQVDDYGDEYDDFSSLELNLVLDCGVIFTIRRDENIPDNLEKYKKLIEIHINTAALLTNAIPGLELEIEEGVANFMEYFEEDIIKFTTQLVREIQ